MDEIERDDGGGDDLPSLEGEDFTSLIIETI